MSEQYSNREIDNHFLEIKEQLDRIEGQTTRTNGRVTKLENWQSLIIGGISVVVAIVIPIVVYTFNRSVSGIETSLASTQQSLQSHITKDLK